MAIYWKYGCWFYERTTRSQVLIESIWDDAASQAGAGTIRLRAWGQTANNLVELLLQELKEETLPRKIRDRQSPDFVQRDNGSWRTKGGLP